MSRLIVLRHPEPGEPTPAQFASGKYAKRRVPWAGLTLAIENEAGTYRRGRKPDGAEWCSFMAFAYGEVLRTEGVDGDPVDVFLGPYMDTAPNVYVIHQRAVDDWDRYDEDKCMLGFMSESDAVDAFLSCYDDPRFLGPITTMTVAEFVSKARATKKEPAMIKSAPTVLLMKSADQADLFDKLVTVKGTTTKRGVQRRPHLAIRHVRAPEPAALAAEPRAMLTKPRARAKKAEAPKAVDALPPLPEAIPVVTRPDALRGRIHAHGLSTLDDAEALEVFLSRSLPHDEAAAFSVAMIQRFGSYAQAVAAPLEDLATVRLPDGRALDRTAAADMKLIHDAALRMANQEIKARKLISGWSALNQYLRTRLAHEPREHMRVIFLDNRNQIIVDEELGAGTVDHAPVYPREIVRRALEVSAKSMILVHNHPSGDPTPSRPDITVTQQVIEASRTMGITVHDHVIVGRDGLSSFKALGLI